MLAWVQSPSSTKGSNLPLAKYYDRLEVLPELRSLRLWARSMDIWNGYLPSLPDTFKAGEKASQVLLLWSVWGAVICSSLVPAGFITLLCSLHRNASGLMGIGHRIRWIWDFRRDLMTRFWGRNSRMCSNYLLPPKLCNVCHYHQCDLQDLQLPKMTLKTKQLLSGQYCHNHHIFHLLI